MDKQMALHEYKYFIVEYRDIDDGEWQEWDRFLLEEKAHQCVCSLGNYPYYYEARIQESK